MSQFERMAEEAIKYAEENKKLVTIGIDFDGTVVHWDYPYVGKTNGRCVEILKRWCNEYNVGLILDTMRHGKELEDAINWFTDNDIPLFGVGKHPTQETWTTSNKCHCSIHIDDRNLGCPLKNDETIPYVDWDKVEELMEPTLIGLKQLFDDKGIKDFI